MDLLILTIVCTLLKGGENDALDKKITKKSSKVKALSFNLFFLTLRLRVLHKN